MRILIVKLSSLGDLFHALPTVHAIRQGLDADIDWVVTDPYRDLVTCFTDVTRVIPFYRHNLLPRLGPFLQALREHHYDLVIDLQGLLKSALVTRLAHTQRRIGPSFHREGSRLFYDEVAAAGGPQPRHAVEACLDVLACLDLPRPEIPEFAVTFPLIELALPRPWIAMAPASRWHTKNWPAERFATAAAELQTRRGGTILLVGAPGDRPVCDHIAQRLDGPVLNLAGQTSLPEMGGYLQAADLLISNDSGPAHVAAAAGTPCVVIFGPTDARRTGPYGPRHRIAKTALPCGPCRRNHCRHTGIPCISGVQTFQVVSSAESILDAGQSCH